MEIRRGFGGDMLRVSVLGLSMLFRSRVSVDFPGWVSLVASFLVILIVVESESDDSIMVSCCTCKGGCGGNETECT